MAATAAAADKQIDAANNWRGTVVFFSMDALGHINPILSIVKELRRRNYRAIILTTRPLSSAARLESLGFELDYCEQQQPSVTSISENDGKTSEQAMQEIMQPLFENFRLGEKAAYEAAYKLEGAVGKHLNSLISSHDIIESKLKSLKPDLIVCDHVAGIPCATSVAPRWCRVYSGFPSALYSSINDNYCAGLGLRLDEMNKQWKDFEHSSKKPLREKLRKFFLEKNCSDWPAELDLSPTSPYINFYLGPQELGLEKLTHLNPLPDSQWFRLEHTINNEDEQPSSIESILTDSFKQLPGKLIYFSLGTLVTCDIGLINRLLKILSKSPNKFIVSMGQMFQHIELYPNMFGEKFVDQRMVLKSADLFITHGGHNSIIEAFYYGVPGLVVLPVFADQFDSAQRVSDCGFGIRLNPFNCTQDELLTAIDSLLANEKLKQSMQTISSRLRSIKYHELACDRLEQLIIKPEADSAGA